MGWWIILCTICMHLQLGTPYRCCLVRDSGPRSDIVNALFSCLQCKDSGRIGSPELLRYAKLSGFDGTDDDWAEEYEDLCAEQGWDKVGLSRSEFSTLMSDEAMGSDEELKAILMELRMPQKRTASAL